VIIRLPSSSVNTWRNKSNGDAKFAITPHRRSTVLVKHFTQRFHGKLGRTRKSIHKKLSFNVQTSSVTRRSQILHAKKGKTLRSYIQRWSIIKNSTEDISDEWAVDAFAAGLRRSDLVEELGRIRPKTVSELIEIASRFTNGEDAYNNKRARSPEVDRASRKMHRSRNEDSCTRRNQVVAGYERRNEEGDESREYRDKNSHEREKPKYSSPSAEDMLHGPCRILESTANKQQTRSSEFEHGSRFPVTTTCFNREVHIEPWHD
jgi:hypothetical protein